MWNPRIQRFQVRQKTALQTAEKPEEESQGVPVEVVSMEVVSDLSQSSSSDSGLARVFSHCCLKSGISLPSSLTEVGLYFQHLGQVLRY